MTPAPQSTPSPAGSYRLVLIAGAGRSGSTLLEMMLDRIPGFTAIGELTDIWDAALGRGELCGCGQPFDRCTFWSAVGERAFGGWSALDLPELLRIHDAVARNRAFPKLVAAPALPRFRSLVDEYANVLGRIYQAVAEVSGCDWIVDASKWPSHAMVLRRIPGVDLRMIQVLRDPRAVAHSWARQVERPHAAGSRSELDMREMRRDRPVVSAAHWTAINLGIEIVRALGVPRHLVRYDELISAPRETLARALEFAGAPTGQGALDFISDGKVDLVPGHGIAGNPVRFRTGEIPLRIQDEWAREMPRRTRAVVSAISAPGQALYRRRSHGAGPDR